MPTPTRGLARGGNSGYPDLLLRTACDALSGKSGKSGRATCLDGLLAGRPAGNAALTTEGFGVDTETSAQNRQLTRP